MSIASLFYIAFWLIISFLLTYNLLFRIDEYLDVKKNKIINGDKKQIKILKLFIVIRREKSDETRRVVFQLTYVLSIIAFISCLISAISFILLCVFSAIGDVNKIVVLVNFICIVYMMIFVLGLVIVHEIVRKKNEKEKKEKEMNFK